MQMQIIRCTVQKSPKAKGAENKETLPQEGVKIDMNRNKAIRKRLALRLEAPERMTFCSVLSSRETVLREETSLEVAAN